jgi:hypothetical protein
MRNAMPVRWIEQAEERQVIAAARLERSPRPPWSEVAADAATQWLPRLGEWLAARHPVGWAAPQVQPAPIPRQASRRDGRRGDADGYRCDW